MFPWLQDKSNPVLGFIISCFIIFSVYFILDSYTICFVLSGWRLFCHAILSDVGEKVWNVLSSSLCLRAALQPSLKELAC